MRGDFASHAEGLAAEKELGEAGLKVCGELFRAWEIYQHTNDPTDLKRAIGKLHRELKPILHATPARPRATAKAAGSRATS